MRRGGAVPFDGNDYRKRVLAAIDARGGAAASDPFEIYDLSLADAERLGDAEVGAQVDQVWAFWQKQRDHPKYRGLVTALLDLHPQLSAQLRTRDGRLYLAADARRSRDERDRDRWRELDAAVGRLVERFGGIPAGKLDGLRRLGAAGGLDAASVRERLDRHPVLDEAPAPSSTGVPDAVFHQVRGDLDELGRLLGVPPPVSLYDLLGLAPGASRQDIAREREESAARNRALRPDRRRALVDDLLAAVGTLLIDGDPDVYLDAVARDVADRFRPRVAAVVLVEDELGPDDAGQLVAEAEAAGLDHGRAVLVVTDLAREHGVRAPRIAPRAATGRTTAPEGARPDVFPRGGSGGGPVGGAGSPIGASGPGRAPSGGAWTAALSAARAALRAGRPAEAQRELARARELAGGTLPPIRALDEELLEALAGAQYEWRAAHDALADDRVVAAAAVLERLAATAADVPGPDGRTAPDVLVAVRARLAAAARSYATVATLSGQDAELALLEVVALAPDHPDARAALAAIGVAPPGAVRAEPQGGGVRVSWRPSPSPGEVDYAVRRAADGRVLGTTRSCELEVGLPPGGQLPAYVVLARRAGIWSAEVSTDGSTRPAPRPPAPATSARPAPPPAAPPPGSSSPVPPRVPTTPSGPPPDLPPAVPTLEALPMGRRLRLVFPVPQRGRGEVRRLREGVPVPVPGSWVVDPGALGDLVPPMGPGLAVDRVPVAARYVVLTIDGAAVAGASVAHGDPPEPARAPVGSVPAPPSAPELSRSPAPSSPDPGVSRLHVRHGMLRWHWPDSCTRVVLAWDGNGPPDGRGAPPRPVTRGEYEDGGGAEIPPQRPLFVVVHPVGTDGRLIAGGAVHLHLPR